jgi:hypothetical protein
MQGAAIMSSDYPDPYPTSPAALFAGHARSTPLQDRVWCDFHELPGAKAINYDTRTVVYDNVASARTFEMEHPGWTARVEK